MRAALTVFSGFRLWNGKVHGIYFQVESGLMTKGGWHVGPSGISKMGSTELQQRDPSAGCTRRLAQPWHCWHLGLCCRKVDCILAFYPSDASSTLSSGCRSQKCPQALPNVPQGGNNALVENHWRSLGKGEVVSQSVKPKSLHMYNEILLLLFSHSVMSHSLWPHGLRPTRLLCPCNFSGKNTGVDCLVFLQGIFPTQGSNPHPLH